MKVLITGNRGFIGSGLEGDGIDLKDGVDIVTYQAKQKYDMVVHTAAKVSVTESMTNPEEYVRTNVMGTLNMLRQHPKAHFVYLSTAAVYGEGMHTVHSPLIPGSVYATTKLAGEFLVKNIARSWCILRLTNVIGKGDRGEPNVHKIFESEEILTVYGDGSQTRDFIDVEDVRKLIVKATNHRGIHNVGSGKSITILELAESFKKPIVFMPERRGELKNFGILDAINLNS